MDANVDTAFVLSSGGNRGAIEAGVLLALLKHGIAPQLLIGSSIGALNAINLATDPTLRGAERLVEIWRTTKKSDAFQGGYLSMVTRLITRKDSFFSNEKIKRQVEHYLPPGVEYFGDITDVKLRIVAANLNTGKLHVFGQDPTESLVDAAMASTAVPPIFPPWEYRGWQYVDGGTVSALPIGVALEDSPKKIYAIDVNFTEEVKPRIKGIFNIVSRTITTMMYQQFLNDLKWAQMERTEAVYHISTSAFQRTRIWDLSHTEEMIEIGQQLATNFLRQEHPTGYVKHQAP